MKWWIIGGVLWLAQYLVLIPAAAWGVSLSILTWTAVPILAWAIFSLCAEWGTNLLNPDRFEIPTPSLESWDIMDLGNLDTRLADRPGRGDGRMIPPVSLQ